MYHLGRRNVVLGLAAAGLVLQRRAAFAQTGADLEAAARKEGRLSVATSASTTTFPRFLDAFKARYPFVDVAAGFYAAPAGRVLARVDAELRSGNINIDVLHVANLAPYLDMARSGRLAPYLSPEIAAYPDFARDGTGSWTVARAVGVVMAYNTKKLAPDKAPRSWSDLLKPEFKGRQIILQNAAAGTAFNQFYQLEKRLGLDYLKKLAAQEPVIVAATGQLIDMLIRGEALVGGTVDHWRAFEPDAVKAGIAAVYPTEGMPVAAAPIAILNKAPNPNAARLFVDFALSKAGQTLLNTEIFGTYSMRPDVAPPPGQMAFADTKPMNPTDFADYEKAASDFPAHFDSIFK
jgi:iron(III) transport system substrate-binding protein